MKSVLFIVSIGLTLIKAEDLNILKACPARAEGTTVLSHVFPKIVYAYLENVKNAKVSVWSKDREAVYIRIALDCEAGTVKVSEMAGGKWTLLSPGTFVKVTCPANQFPVVFHQSGKEVYIGEQKIALMSGIKPDYGDMEVKGDVNVVSLAGGNCAEYPSTIKTCVEAAGWYSKFSRCDGRDGFYNCNSGPTCKGDMFAPVQTLTGNNFACTKPDGRIVSDGIINTNRLNDVTMEEYCDVLVNTS